MRIIDPDISETMRSATGLRRFIVSMRPAMGSAMPSVEM
jgi:hypothetical protein